MATTTINVNSDILEKASKKVRKERNRKKKKRLGIDDLNEETHEEKNEEENNNIIIEEQEQVLTPPPVPKKFINMSTTGGRVFASNPVVYKQRRHINQSRNNDDNNSNEEKEEDKSEIDENNEKTESLKNDLAKAVEDKNTAQIPNFVQQLKELQVENINFRYSDGFTLLHKAIQKSSTEVIQLLLDNGAVINIPSMNGLSPLHFAAQQGDLQIVEFLLSKSANPMQRDIENKSCLHHAVLGKNLAIVELIAKQQGVLINHRDNSGCSSLHYAVRAECKDIVDFLLNKGADPLLQDSAGNRPIDYIPGFSRYVSLKHLKLSHQGKKVLSLLKKRGGHRVPITTPKPEVVGGGLSRSRSLDHRNGLSDLAKNNITIPNFPPPKEKKKETVKEEDLELLYYNPTPRPEERVQAPSTPLPPPMRTDRYGFITSSNSDLNLSKQQSKVKEEKMALKWLDIIKNWEDSKIKGEKLKKIQKYCDRGIPDTVRGMAWKLIAGCVYEEDVSYIELLERDSIPKVKEQILKDITRTMPNHVLFREKGQGQQMLTNVLTAYSVYKPNVGYCQGMGFITAMFLMYMPEEDAFWMLNRITDEYRFARLWDEHLALVSECMFALNVLMQQYLPEVHAKLEEDNIQPGSYVPQFFITGFLINLPFSMVVRVWDCFLLRKFDYLYAVAIAIFKVTKDKVLKMNLEQMMVFLKFKDSGEELDFTADQLLRAAANIWSRFSPSHIRKLEEEGARVREKERLERM